MTLAERLRVGQAARWEEEVTLATRHSLTLSEAEDTAASLPPLPHCPGLGRGTGLGGALHPHAHSWPWQVRFLGPVSLC